MTPRWRFTIGTDDTPELVTGEFGADDRLDALKLVKSMTRALGRTLGHDLGRTLTPANQGARVQDVLYAHEIEGTISGAARLAGVSRETATKYLRAHGKVD
jgi:transcriptional regulator of acetoin/glycerol metabolism